MEKEKRFSYIRKKPARGTAGACILSGLAFLLFLFCIAYSFYRKGEAGVRIVYPSSGKRKISGKKTDIYCCRSGYFSIILLAVFPVFGD